VIVTSGGVSWASRFRKPRWKPRETPHVAHSMKPGRRSLSARRAGELIGCPESGLELRDLSDICPAFLLKTQGIARVDRTRFRRARFRLDRARARREFLRVKWNARGGSICTTRRIPRY